jgi:hypothetical protein
VVECHGRIVPLETKSGASGAMKSLHQFMHDKSLPLAVRVDRNPPSLQKMRVKTTLGDPVEYQLVNIPNYLAWRTPALINCLQ